MSTLIRRPFPADFFRADFFRADPFTGDVDALVRRAFGPGPARLTRPAGFTPAVDVTRDGEDAVVALELPGIDAAQDVHVDVEEGRLVVHGERRDERSAEQQGRRFREVRYGSFRRAFALPEHVTAEAVTASYEAGVLRVRIAGAYATPEKAGVTSIAVSVPEQPAVEQASSDQPTSGQAAEQE